MCLDKVISIRDDDGSLRPLHRRVVLWALEDGVKVNTVYAKICRIYELLRDKGCLTPEDLAQLG